MTLRRLLPLGLLFIATLLSLSGCGGSNDTLARFVHAVLDGGRVDVLVNDRVVASNVSFRSATQSISVDSGSVTVRFRQSGTSTILLSRTFTFLEGDQQTVVFGGFANPVAGEPGLEARAYTGDSTLPQSGKYRVRAIHAAGGTDLSPADVYINRTNQTQNQTNPVFTNQDFRDVTNYAEFDAGTRRIIITESGDKNNVFYDSQGDDVTFAEQTRRTIVLVDSNTQGEMERPIILVDEN